VSSEKFRSLNVKELIISSQTEAVRISIDESKNLLVDGNLSGSFTGNIDGNASTVTNGVYTVGEQTISGIKTFNDGIVGNLIGNADTATSAESATTALNVSITNDISTNAVRYITFVDGASGNNALKVDSSTLLYLPSTNTLATTNIQGNSSTVTNGVYTVGNQTIGGAKEFSNYITGSITGSDAKFTSITGSLLGNATTSTNASYVNIQNGDGQNNDYWVLFAADYEQPAQIYGDEDSFRYNPSTDTLIVTNLNGNAATVTNGVYLNNNQTITGQKTFSSVITGSITGSKAEFTSITGSLEGNASSATRVNLLNGNSIANVSYIPFSISSTGNSFLYTDTALTYTPSSDQLRIGSNLIVNSTANYSLTLQRSSTATGDKCLIRFINSTTSTAYSGFIGTIDAGSNGIADLVLGSQPSSDGTSEPLERIRILANGNVAIGTTTSALKLTVNGALGLTSRNEELVSDNINITVGNSSYIKILSDETPASSRTFTLSNGLQIGQILILESAQDDCELLNIGNVKLSSDWQAGTYDTLMLLWNGSYWLELSRSNN
jgi:hypothetical protein